MIIVMSSVRTSSTSVVLDATDPHELRRLSPDGGMHAGLGRSAKKGERFDGGALLWGRDAESHFSGSGDERPYGVARLVVLRLPIVVVLILSSFAYCSSFSRTRAIPRVAVLAPPCCAADRTLR